jgi:hypothetical protein
LSNNLAMSHYTDGEEMWWVEGCRKVIRTEPRGDLPSNSINIQGCYMR